ncbi:MAG: hypothetical protein A2Z14_13930 [Chloroflexi bacterium RBG_16_48_8]|nr:MAG: hypothetical protein A2Z14_13930 [Chloroflexi bacterium RBG_16_48_8]
MPSSTPTAQLQGGRGFSIPKASIDTGKDGKIRHHFHTHYRKTPLELQLRGIFIAKELLFRKIEIVQDSMKGV